MSAKRLRFMLYSMLIGFSGWLYAGVVGSDAWVARVDDQSIGVANFNQIFANRVRRKFYHGRPPEREWHEFQQKVLLEQIDDLVLEKAADREGIKPDRTKIEKELANEKLNAQRQGLSEGEWKQFENELKEHFVRQTKIESLEKKINSETPVPNRSQVKEFYEQNPGLFTEPERVEVSLILLKVNPGSGVDAVDEAKQRMLEIKKKISDRESFHQLAREYSEHASAAEGGRLGYLHKGMLPDGTESIIGELDVGEVSEPVRVLEGIALIQLESRNVPQLNTFSAVKSRDEDLLRRKMISEKWESYVMKARRDFNTEVNKEMFPEGLEGIEQSVKNQASKN